MAITQDQDGYYFLTYSFGDKTIQVQKDTTSSEVVDRYEKDYQDMLDVYKKGDNIDDSETQKFIDAWNDLKDLMENGMVVSNGDYQTVTSVMAGWYGGLDASLKQYNIDFGGSTGDIKDALRKWAKANSASNAQFGVTDILSMGAQASNSNHSIQNMLEVGYIAVGNRILGDNLSQLKDALKLTNSALQLLDQVQTIHNYVTPIQVKDPDSAQHFVDAMAAGNDYTDPNTGKEYKYSDTNDVNSYLKAYQEITKYLSEPVDVQLNYPGSDPTHVSDDDLTAFQDLVKKIGDLLPQILSANPGSDSQPNSLYSTLDQVYKDMLSGHSDHHDITKDDVEKWILDNQTQADANSQSGYLAENFQANITSAITAAESLNDQQKEQTQSVLYLFQQFYQSASSALSTINSIIRNMAQAAGG